MDGRLAKTQSPARRKKGMREPGAEPTSGGEGRSQRTQKREPARTRGGWRKQAAKAQPRVVGVLGGGRTQTNTSPIRKPDGNAFALRAWIPTVGPFFSSPASSPSSPVLMGKIGNS